MKTSIRGAFGILMLGGIGAVLGTFSIGLEAQTPAPGPVPAAGSPAASRPPSKFRDFAEVTKDTQKFEGLFNLYRTNEILYAELKSNQFDQPFLAPITIARGMASAGQPLNFGNEWILVFHRDGDKVQIIRRNIHYQAPVGTPLEKAVKQNYTDSVLMALPIVSLASSGGVVIDFSQVFLTDFADLRIGQFDRNRSTWFKIKAFPNNIELQVQATFGRGGVAGSIDLSEDGVADARGITLVIHYSLSKLPEPGYKPRLADARVGQFVSATKDFGSTDPDSMFVRRINRWRIEKADPKAKVSPPKKQLVWWVEDTVPHEYRPYVQDGILEWNKAFEKIGFRDAIGVRWQNDRDEFDPEDINYCTFRWITTSSTFAMSGLRADPITGEMIDGDVIFDASWIRAFKVQYAFLVGRPYPNAMDAQDDAAPWAMAEVISPILAAKKGFGLPYPLPGIGVPSSLSLDDNPRNLPVLLPADGNPLRLLLSRRLGPSHLTACHYMASKQYELGLAAIALAQASPGAAEPKLPEEFLGQVIKEVVMHEVGHSLGLRHNFRASAMLPLDQVNDTSITRTKGMVASVMDYNPINIAPPGQKQGDYATTVLGPYDYWAIEYAYRPFEGDEIPELKKIAARSPEPDLAYATDEDMYLNNDPFVNTYDLGRDPLQYGRERLAMARALLQNLDEKVVRDGESWVRLRRAFSILFSQYANAAGLAAGYLGGQEVSRDFKGGEASRDPVTPISGDRQREALQFLATQIFDASTFEFNPRILRRLAAERWYHWGNQSLTRGDSVDYDVYGRVLAIQRIVLSQCFDPEVLNRLQNQALQSDPDAHPLRIDEVFQSLTDSIWTEYKPDSVSSSERLAVSTIRRNLQREHLRRLSVLVLGGRSSSLADNYSYVVFLGASGAPADARSLARTHLVSIQGRLKNAQRSGARLDATTRAHVDECLVRIQRILAANASALEP